MAEALGEKDSGGFQDGDKLCNQLHLYEMELEYLLKLHERRTHNKRITNYYTKLGKETPFGRQKFENKVENMTACNSLHFLEIFKDLKIKNWTGTNLCRDKFCYNCKVIKAVERRRKFEPLIEQAKEEGLHLFHLVLTIPNCHASELEGTIANLHKGIAKLMQYLNGKRKIQGLSFLDWGYDGAIRSTEVTYKSRSEYYHPHAHILLAMKEDFIGEKTISNAFSKDRYNKRPDRLFSEEEVLIQNLWYLIWNMEAGEKITRKKILAVEQGYSCMVDKFKDEDYHELFKYMTKTNAGQMTYENFKTLYEALHGMRQIQGYKRFFGVSEELSDELEMEKAILDDFYEEIHALLLEKEAPSRGAQTLKELMLDNEYTLINLKKVAREIFEVMKKDSLD